MSAIEDLGRRAVACRHWRWMPGMLATGRDPHVDYSPCWSRVQGRAVVEHIEDVDELDPTPDLSDPATLGCLLALVREAWGGHGAVWAVNRTFRYVGKRWSSNHVRTEAESLVAALEAAR